MIEVTPLLGLFKDNINSLAADLEKELSQKLDKSFEVYVQNWYDKISEAKTFLFRDQKVKFEDIYFPISIKLSNKHIVDTEDFQKLFESGNCITILGNAGSGKTMLIRHLFLNSIEKGFRIPLMIELRKLNTEGMSFKDYVTSQIFNFDLAKSDKIMRRLFENGDFLFFLDGYDEISLNSLEKRTKEIEEFVDTYPANNYVLTSRPEDEIRSLSRFNNFYVQSLSKDQVTAFIKKHLSKLDDGKDIEKKIIPAIETANQNISAYFSNPLLLSLFVITYGYHPEIPQKRTDFYFNVFDTLFIKHDTITKGGGFVHKMASNLDKGHIEKLLEYFSYRTYFKEQYLFSEQTLHTEFEEIKKRIGFNFDVDNLLHDLEISICLLLKDGIDYTFPHRSLQEYFTAKLIMGQSESDRQKIYKSVIFKRPHNGNLWILCNELNPLDFKKNFLLPNMKEVVTKLDEAVNIVAPKNKGKALLDYVINQSMITFSYGSNNTTSSSYRNFEKDYFFKFCGFNHGLLNEVHDTLSFYREELEPHVSIVLDTVNNTTIRKANLSMVKTTFLPYLIKCGLPDRLLKIYEGMRALVFKMEQDIRNSESNNDALLEII